MNKRYLSLAPRVPLRMRNIYPKTKMAVQETAAQLSMALKVQEYPTLKVGNCLLFNEHTRENGRARLSWFRLAVWLTL